MKVIKRRFFVFVLCAIAGAQVLFYDLGHKIDGVKSVLRKRRA